MTDSRLTRPVLWVAFVRRWSKIVYPIAKSLQNSRDLQNVLGVDRNVSWQIFKLLGPIETLSTVSYIPAAVSLRKVLSAAKKRGVSEEIAAEASSAFAAFERFVTQTTGDREQFETMVMSYSDSAESAQMSMHHRKAAFKADCHFFGVACDTLSMALFFPSGQDAGNRGFCRIAADAGVAPPARQHRCSGRSVEDQSRFGRARERSSVERCARSGSRRLAQRRRAAGVLYPAAVSAGDAGRRVG